MGVQDLTKEIGTRETLKTLEIGAINTHIRMSMDDVTAIDLNSLHPKIHECDFFNLKPSLFDVVVCAMFWILFRHVYREVITTNIRTTQVKQRVFVCSIRCVNKSKYGPCVPRDGRDRIRAEEHREQSCLRYLRNRIVSRIGSHPWSRIVSRPAIIHVKTDEPVFVLSRCWDHGSAEKHVWWCWKFIVSLFYI